MPHSSVLARLSDRRRVLTPTDPKSKLSSTKTCCREASPMSKFVLLACLIGFIALAPQSRADDVVSLDGKTKQYRLTLQIGPTETMYSAAEAKAKSPTSG